MAYYVRPKMQLKRTLPFSKADETTDIVFVVQKRRIHFTKAILSACSPVFRAMFEEEFAGQGVIEIPLPEKKYNDMLELCKHLHPAYGPMTQVTDDTLFTLLALSSEYQIESVREKCQQFIGHQTEVAQAEPMPWGYPEKFSVDKNLFYLSACEKFQLHEQQKPLLELIAMRDWSDLAKSPLNKEYEVTPSLWVKVLKRKFEMIKAKTEADCAKQKSS